MDKRVQNPGEPPATARPPLGLGLGLGVGAAAGAILGSVLLDAPAASIPIGAAAGGAIGYLLGLAAARR